MASGDVIELEGKVKEALPGSKFVIELTTEGFEGHLLHATLSGKMRMHYIKIVQGDRVTVQVSPQDLERGRITFRSK